MGLPTDLVLVRHGESEGNIATAFSKKNDDRHFTPEFRSRHSSSWRLSDKGIEQAKAAGEWVRRNIGTDFDRYYTSEYIRAMETAHYLQLPEAKWFADFLLRERNWGDMDILTAKERDEKYSDSMRKKEIDSFYWTPPNGESMADLCLRLRWVLDTLHRECDGKRVVIVCHGEVMWGIRILLERMPQCNFLELDRSKDPINRIHNCQIIHYTRRNPFKEEGVGKYTGWRRSVCPWDETLSSNDWEEIKRPVYNNEDLLKTVQKINRMVNE